MNSTQTVSRDLRSGLVSETPIESGYILASGKNAYGQIEPIAPTGAYQDLGCCMHVIEKPERKFRLVPIIAVSSNFLVESLRAIQV